MSHLESPQSAVHLVHTMSGDLVQLGALGDQALFDAGVPPELREGEVVQCLRNDPHGVLVARGDGSRLLIPLTGARRVGVRWFPELHDADGSGIGRRPGVEETR